MLNVLILAATMAAVGDAEGPPKGCLIVVGGGPSEPTINERTLQLAGGPDAHVVVIPQASGNPKAGEFSVERWKQVGAKNVVALDLADPKAAVAAVQGADLIWVRGGNQSRLMTALAGTGVPEAIVERYRRGAVVGGTSAGAAVMSRVMIAGYGGPPGSGRKFAKTADGLGLWPEVIVDMHFDRRARLDRLKHAVSEHPGLLGVGIAESTAVVVRGHQFEVIGKGEVTVVDSHAAEPKEKPEGEVKTVAHNDFATVVLKPGMRFDLDKRLLAK